MTFTIRTLRHILHRQAGLAPWHVHLFSDFRRDLGLTDAEIGLVLDEIGQLTGLTFPVDTAKHLTDVFDLLIHVILRLPETYDAEHYYGPLPAQFTDRLPLTNYAPTLIAFGAVHLN
ncbi:hypothetical protein [Fibrella aestuarina]|nr:hypothetical protein [Fibrella aestuarina]